MARMMLALKLGGSLLAILLLAWLAKRLGLGGDTRIRGEDHARALADEAMFGFDAQEVAIDRAGNGALLRDASGRVLLLRRHGAHFAARLLDHAAQVRFDENRLTLATADRRFGEATLDLGDHASAWAENLRRPSA